MSLLLAMALAPPQATCVTCHPEERVQFEVSVHAQEGIGCDSCHGGDPQTLDVDRAHDGDFAGVPVRTEIPEGCASCHSDPSRMRPYNLSIDQLALYQISVHGRQLAKGDERVAVCTDCHGTHDIRRVDDPASSAYATNVPETCARCHADEALMSAYGLSGDAVEDYSRSVHASALLKEGNPNAPSCAQCHGVHGATPPGVGDVEKVCGQCHTSAREFFLESIHKEAMDAAGLPECASCHGNHEIQPAGSELAREVCTTCHDPGSQAAEVGERLLTLQAAATQEIQQAQKLIDEAEQVPMDVEDYRARIELARTQLQTAYPVMHSLEIDKVSPFTASARSEAEDIQREIYDKFSDIRIRRLGLGLFWFYIVLTVAILIRLRHRSAAA